MTIVRAIVVDDEPIARRGLRSFLQRRPDIEQVAECRNGNEAVTTIRSLRPDLVLLDVQMPGLDGLGVIRTIGSAEMPSVVFITAFDEYAVHAFELAAVDYVVKPYTIARLGLAIDRALVRMHERRVTADHERLLEALGSANMNEQLQPIPQRVPYAERLIVSVGTRREVVPLDAVTLLTADGYHVVVSAERGRFVLRESLQALEARLDPTQFRRVHRSTIVRLSAVRSVHRVKPDQIVLRMTDGTRIPVSRSRRASVLEGLNGIRG